MALIVETGTGVVDANSYITVAEATAYHTLYGNTDWAGDDATLEQALIVSCLALDLLYGPKYVSQRLTNTQPLLFPRYAFTDNTGQTHTSNVIPKRLKDAQAELALLYIQGVDVFPEENQTTGITQESIKLGDIQTSTTYSKAPQKATFDGFRKIDITLYPLLKINGPVLAFSR